MATVERKLYRLPDQGMVAGVAAGFAKYLEVDVTIVRLIIVALTLLTGGGGIIAYIILAIVIPKPHEATLKAEDVGKKFEDLVEEVKDNGRARRIGNYFGIGLILVGAWLLIGRIFPGWFDIQWNLVGPLLIILLGVVVIMRSKTS